MTHKKTNIIIHNANQIGGCITDICYNNEHILIDFGENLPGHENQNYNYDFNSNNVIGVFFTHYHGDHIGRIKEINQNIPLYMGEITQSVLSCIYKTVHNEEMSLLINDSNRINNFHENVPIKIGNFTITPYTIDHSAYDAYMLLIETPDTTIIHTGDFREHGHRGFALEKVIKTHITKYGKREIDILITEGTMLSRSDEKPFTERDLMNEATKIFEKNKYIFLLCSSTNLDSLASFYHAAKRKKICLYGNGYFVNMLSIFSETAGSKTSLYKFDKVFKLLPPKKELHSKKSDRTYTQEELMRKFGFLALISGRESDYDLIERFSDLNPKIIYSMWNGYLDKTKKAYSEKLGKLEEKYKDKFIYLHTSGHAYKNSLEKVINLINPNIAIMPMHTDNKNAFLELNISPTLKERILFSND